MQPDLRTAQFGVGTEPESPLVIFFEMLNASGTATLHITFRAFAGEGETAFMQRVTAFIKWVDAGADLTFKFKDAPKGFGRSGAGSKPQAPAIEGGGFSITAVERLERPNKDTTKAAWSILRAYGMQNGAEIFADCFYGSLSFVRPDNAVTACGYFPDFLQWPVGVKRSISSPHSAIVIMNPTYKTWEITSITP